MNNLKLVLLSLMLTSTTSIAQDCAAPAVPTLPEGATATMDQMVAGQQAVKAFQAANLEYMNCMDPVITAATNAAKAEDASDESKVAAKQLEEQYNAAVSKEEQLAGQFNAALKEFKAANPG